MDVHMDTQVFMPVRGEISYAVTSASAGCGEQH